MLTAPLLQFPYGAGLARVSQLVDVGRKSQEGESCASCAVLYSKAGPRWSYLDLYGPIQSYMLAMLDVVAQACNPGTRGAEAGGLL